MKNIMVVDKVDNETIRLEYDDGTSENISVIRIESRQKALELLEQHTRAALKLDTAFDQLNYFIPKSRYARLRNYEIEKGLETITGVNGYRIDELCPFNGFSWFS